LNKGGVLGLQKALKQATGGAAEGATGLLLSRLFFPVRMKFRRGRSKRENQTG